MRFKGLLLFLLLLAKAGWASPAAEPFVSPDNSDYKAVRGLQQQLGEQDLLPEGGAGQKAVVLALAEVAQKASEELPSQDMRARDYDALFALLQKYRDELRDLRAEKEDLQSQVVTLRAKQHELEEKLLHGDQPLDGLKINGKFSMVMLDSATSGPGSPLIPDPSEPGKLLPSQGRFLREREGDMDQDVIFTGTRGMVSAVADLDFKLYTGIDQAYFIGSRNIQVELRTPLAVQIGDLNSQLTPFTLWRSEDEDPFESDPFSSRRQRVKDELGLKENAVHLRGLRLATDLSYEDKPIVHLQGFFHEVGYPNAVLYYMPAYPSPSGSYPYLDSGLNNGAYNTYLGLWQASTSPLGLELSYTGSMMRNSTDSNSVTYDGSGPLDPFSPAVANPSQFGPAGTQQVRGFDSQVHSLGLKTSLLDGLAGLDAEYARSLYSNPNEPALNDDPSIGPSGYSFGNALRAELDSKAHWYHARVNFRQVDSNFISSPAQGRTQDTQASLQGPFPHDNTQYDPADGLFFDSNAVIPRYGETEYTRIFLPPQFMDFNKRFHGNYLLPYNAAVNPSTPYGLATPNRQGYGLNLELTPWDGFTPMLLYDNAQQITPNLVSLAAPVEHYSLIGAGLNLDLQRLLKWPFQILGGWQQRGIDNSAAVSFKSSMIDLGMSWSATPSLTFFAGAKTLSYQGSLDAPLYGGYQDPLTGGMIQYDSANVVQAIAVQAYAYDQSFESWSIGLNYQILAKATIQLYYGNEYFVDNLALAAGHSTNYELDQGYVRYSMEF